ncbi:hypothetical protein [Limnospira platensis]|nr:hypothetical protein [Arthrospira platensis NCB002]QQW26957.2 hypothetical protein AP9108_16385 [Arthrospira sp. PCC 9108]
MRSRAEEEGDRPIIADSQGRELLAETRHHDEHIHETMLSRAAQEGDRARGACSEPNHSMAHEQARELLAETRHHDEHIHETMLSRSSEGY